VRAAREIVRRNRGAVGKKDYAAFTACLNALVHAVRAFTAIGEAPLPPTISTPVADVASAGSVVASDTNSGEEGGATEAVNGERPVNARGKTVRERVKAAREQRTWSRIQQPKG
jgi:hypothetical protein